MKKKLAALLCGVMCMSAATGCSQAELNYLAMSTEMATMSAAEAKGQLTVDVDLNAFVDFANELDGVTGVDASVVVEDAGLSGKESVTFDYVMRVDMNTLGYELELDAVHEGKTYDFGTMYFDANNGVVVSDEAVWSTYEVMLNLGSDAKDAEAFEAYKAATKDALAKAEYIEVVSGEDMGMEEVAFEEDSMEELTEATNAFLTEIMEGFETGLITEVENGFKLDMGSRKLVELLGNVVDYAAKDPDKFVAAAEKYMNAVAEETGDAEVVAEMQAAVEEMKVAVDTLAAEAVERRAALDELLADAEYSTVVDSFRLTETVKKANGAFVSDGLFEVGKVGAPFLKCTTAAEVKELKGWTVKLPANAVSVEALGETLTAVEAEYNPVVGTNVLWFNDEEVPVASLSAVRNTSSTLPFVYVESDYAEGEVIVKDGRSYLPLRAICDMLGVDVEWNNAEKTAYVGETPMKGILQNGRSFVAVRDFEKLGYTVEYTSDAELGMRTVSIVK